MSCSALPKWAAGRVDDLSQRKPEFLAIVRFYPTDEGGRKGPVPNGFGCSCILTKLAKQSNDVRLLFDKDWTKLGEEAVVSFFFLHGEEAAKRYREAGQFFLWEGRIIADVNIL